MSSLLTAGEVNVYVNVTNIHIEAVMNVATYLDDIGKPAWISASRKLPW